MSKQDQDPFQVISELIASAVSNARVLGESRRITTLVASSIQRFAAEMKGQEAEAFLGHALECITPEDVPVVPHLYAAIQDVVNSHA